MIKALAFIFTPPMLSSYLEWWAFLIRANVFGPGDYFKSDWFGSAYDVLESHGRSPWRNCRWHCDELSDWAITHGEAIDLIKDGYDVVPDGIWVEYD